MASPHDITKATKTYDSFIGSLKWVVPLIAIITLVIVILIAD
ncbi:aa3-type cytochrome c oxidase subunit IV [Qipengyuania sp. SM2507]